MVVQIQIRRDTAADWTSNDPTLAEGEIGFETDTNKAKIGDGSTAWTALDYFGGGDLILDTTPQLGGDLDLNSKNIDFPTTANISDCLDEDDLVSDSATMLATQQSIKAYIDSLNMIGAANGKWIAMTGFTDDNDKIRNSGGYLSNRGVAADWFSAYLTIPMQLGSLSLHIDDLILNVYVADASDYVDRIVLKAVNRTSTLAILDDSTNRTAAGDYTYAFAAVDIGTSYFILGANILFIGATINELKFVPPRVFCYYA